MKLHTAILFLQNWHPVSILQPVTEEMEQRCRWWCRPWVHLVLSTFKTVSHSEQMPSSVGVNKSSHRFWEGRQRPSPHSERGHSLRVNGKDWWSRIKGWTAAIWREQTGQISTGLWLNITKPAVHHAETPDRGYVSLRKSTSSVELSVSKSVKTTARDHSWCLITATLGGWTLL